MPRMPFIGVRISWLICARKARLGMVCRVGMLLGRAQRFLVPDTLRDIARDDDELRRLAVEGRRAPPACFDRKHLALLGAAAIDDERLACGAHFALRPPQARADPRDARGPRSWSRSALPARSRRAAAPPAIRKPSCRRGSARSDRRNCRREADSAPRSRGHAARHAHGEQARDKASSRWRRPRSTKHATSTPMMIGLVPPIGHHAAFGTLTLMSNGKSPTCL